MNTPLAFNTAQAARFLQSLAGHDPVTFQTFSDRDDLKITRPDGKQFDPNAMWRHGTLKELDPHLRRMNSRGAGIYIMVNAGDGRGRSTKNVVGVRALFLDTDGAPLPTDTPLKPHLIVESSPGKYHLYWRVTGLELPYFSVFQLALAKHYGTDPTVKDLPRVMRVAGFYHCKGEPVMVQLLEAHDHPPCTPADIFRAWPFVSERLEQERVLEAEARQLRAEQLRLVAKRKTYPLGADDQNQKRAFKILEAHYDRVANAANGTRHSTLKESAYTLGGYVGSGTLEWSVVEQELSAAAITCGLPDAEAADVIRWGLKKGTEKPLALTEHISPRIPFGAKPSFDADRVAPKKNPALSTKVSLGQSGTHRTTSNGKPSLGGKRCR